jgi:hypothetical protein
VSRPQSQAARPWLLRWLLVVLTVTGLGVWPGGRCADGVSAHHPAQVAAVSAADAAALATTASSAPGRHGVDHWGPSGKPGTTADECHIAPPTTVTTTVTTAAPLPPAEARSVAVTPRPRPPMPCFSPGVALIHLGVSRT